MIVSSSWLVKELSAKSFGISKLKTGLLSGVPDLEQKNFKCDITYDHIFTEDGKKPTDNVKELNSEFRKHVKNKTDLYELHKLYRICNKKSWSFKDDKTSILEIINNLSVNQTIDFKPFKKCFIYDHNKNKFLKTYADILQDNLYFINFSYKIYVYRKLLLIELISKISDNKINSKNVFKFKCDKDIDDFLKN